MKRGAFNKPINTLVGLGFLRPIGSVEEAYAFLMDWRGLREGGNSHTVALKAVKAALAGEIEAETARTFVEIFAKQAGVLAPDMETMIAGAAATSRGDSTAH